MKKIVLLLAVIAVIAACSGQPSKINGVSYVASGDPTTQKQVSYVKDVHANYAAVMPFAFVRSLETPVLNFNHERQWYGERVQGVTQYTEMLQQNDIQVMLKPQIWVWNGEFTGYLKMTSEEDWNTFETSYKEFILLYAQVAADLNVSIYCIGTELEQFILKRPQFWSELISEVKKIYKGKLTYAANWDEYKRVPFWKQLDYVGVDGYFPISEQETPSVEDARKGWQKWKTELQQVSTREERPILFTEYGYRSFDYAGKEPWQSNRSKTGYNMQAQTNLYQAFFAEIYKEPWFSGGFIWKWFITHEGIGGENNNQFTPQNKPAQATIEAFFKEQ